MDRRKDKGFVVVVQGGESRLETPNPCVKVFVLALFKCSIVLSGISSGLFINRGIYPPKVCKKFINSYIVP